MLCHPVFVILTNYDQQNPRVMKLFLSSILFLAVFFTPLSAQRYQEMIDAGTYTLNEIRQEAEAYFNVAGHGRGTGYKPYKRWEYVAQRELDAAGIKIPNYDLASQARAYRTQEAQLRGNSINSGGWHQLGPIAWNATSGWNPGLGRITSIGIEGNNPSHYIVGSPTGGVWKTLDNGNTWLPLTDNFSTVDVYALEISPFDNNFYLWGSTSGRIFKSTDGGSSWTATGNVSGSGKVSRILFHPTDPNIVYAVSESNGLFRSTNGGNTWTGVSGVSGIVGYDVQMKPNDPNTIYFSGVNVFRSTNGGASFTQINGFGTSNNNYKRMAVSPASPNVVYVLESNGGRFGGFYKSTDSGATFTELVDGATINYFGYSETGDDDSGQAPRNMAIAANPLNANEVHIGGVHTWKSINGGQSFSLTSFWTPYDAVNLGVGYNHADIGIIKFYGNKMFVSSDGGIFTSTDGANTFQNRSVGLCIREFYKIGVSKTNPNVVSGGSQDNGTSIMRGASRQWVDWLGADGMESFVDWNNASIVYGTSQYGSMYRSNNQGTTETDLSGPPGVGNGNWVTPFEQDPQVSTTVYAAFQDVWKSTDSGDSWTQISNFNNGNFDEMKLAPSDNQRIYVSRGSDLFTTSDGGGAWSTCTKAWGGNAINYISVHPHNPQRVLIVTASAVYQSTNAGNSWTNISNGLPGGAKYCAVWEDKGSNGIYVGGFGFVSYTNDNLSGQWVGFFDGLPNARVYELEINYVSNSIFAGTYGRGLWESPLYQAVAPAADFSADIQTGCPEMTVQFNDQSANYPTSWEWSFAGGTPATSSLRNPVVTYSTPGSYTVQLKATNGAGESSIVKQHSVYVFDPAVYSATGAVRCDSGEVKLSASTGGLFETLNWFDSPVSQNPVQSGDTLTMNIGQSATYYVSAGYDYPIHTYVGAESNAIGDGGYHLGGYYLLFDAYKPFRLKSARVYAVGSGNRTFQLLDINQNVLLEKTVFVPDGESRITLDMDIPQGYDLQLGCATSANLYRNNSGPAYPYTAAGLMQIKGSSAGPDYYYYLYDMELESTSHCEGDRVAVQAIVNHAPDAPGIATAGIPVICPNGSVEIGVQNLCTGCTVKWSNGATDSLISVSNTGIYSATVSNGCGASAPSNDIEVNAASLPEALLISAVGDTVFCPNLPASVLSAANICPDCNVIWSNGESGSSINVTNAGVYSAVQHNVCGDGPVSNTLAFTAGALPPQPEIGIQGPTLLCPGMSAELMVTNSCPGCQVLWSDGQTDPLIIISQPGTYTVSYQNACGETPASDSVEILASTLPETPEIGISGPSTLCLGDSTTLFVSNICPGCFVQWSDGAYTDTIQVGAGIYSAVTYNVCGESPARDTVEIILTFAPETPEINASGSTALCPGTSVELSVSNLCTGCSINWSNGDTSPTTIVSVAGNYSAMMSNGCGISQSSDDISVTNASLPDTPLLSIPGPLLICPGDTIELTLLNICQGCSVQWSNGAAGNSLKVFESGSYSATFENRCGAGPASLATVVGISPLPDPPMIQPSGVVNLCPGDSVTLNVVNDVCFHCPVHWSNGATGLSTVVSSQGIYSAYTENIFNQCGNSPQSNEITVTNYPLFVPVIEISNTCHLSAPAGSNYQWYIDSLPIPGATSQEWTAELNGNYTVSMTNADGCPGTSTATPVQGCMSSTHAPDAAFSTRLYPNPARGRVYLEVNPAHATVLRLELFAADGKFAGRLFEGAVMPGKQVKEIALPTLPAGVYRYRLTAGEEVVEGNLVVEQR